MKIFYLILVLLLFTIQSIAQEIRVEILTSNASTIITATPAVNKYNKPAVFMLEHDDGGQYAYDIFAYLKGFTDRQGIKHKGKRFNDGAGLMKPYTIGIALNSMNNYTNSEYWTQPERIQRKQVAEMVTGGNAILNHGRFHFKCGVRDQLGWENAACLANWDNIKENEKYWYRQTSANGSPFITRVMVNPSNDSGYMYHADTLGYLATSSQGTWDGYPYVEGGSPSFIPNPVPAAFRDYRRSFSDDWVNFLPAFKGEIDRLLDGATPSNPKMWRVGTHMNGSGPHWESLKKAFDYVESKGNAIWVTSLHEFLEYHEIKRIVEPTKTITINGNKTVFTYNFKDVPKKNHWRDMSIILSVSGGTIQSVNVAGDDKFSFNQATGLLNIYLQKKAVSRPLDGPR